MSLRKILETFKLGFVPSSFNRKCVHTVVCIVALSAEKGWTMKQAYPSKN